MTRQFYDEVVALVVVEVMMMTLTMICWLYVLLLYRPLLTIQTVMTMQIEVVAAATTTQVFAYSSA